MAIFNSYVSLPRACVAQKLGATGLSNGVYQLLTNFTSKGCTSSGVDLEVILPRLLLQVRGSGCEVVCGMRVKGFLEEKEDGPLERSGRRGFQLRLSQWALPDFICQLQITVGTAGLHVPAPDRSGHCRTSSASNRLQWALPDLIECRELFSDADVVVESASELDFAKESWTMSSGFFVIVGCRVTCELCIPSSDTTTAAAGTTAVVTTTEPEIVWPGAADAIHLVVAITARTDLVRDTVANQVEYIKTDPQPLLLVLYDELEAIGLSGAAIPGLGRVAESEKTFGSEPRYNRWQLTSGLVSGWPSAAADFAHRHVFRESR
eukprot:s429_g4.t1